MIIWLVEGLLLNEWNLLRGGRVSHVLFFFSDFIYLHNPSPVSLHLPHRCGRSHRVIIPPEQIMEPGVQIWHFGVLPVIIFILRSILLFIFSIWFLISNDLFLLLFDYRRFRGKGSFYSLIVEFIQVHHLRRVKIMLGSWQEWESGGDLFFLL